MKKRNKIWGSVLALILTIAFILPTVAFAAEKDGIISLGQAADATGALDESVTTKLEAYTESGMRNWFSYTGYEDHQWKIDKGYHEAYIDLGASDENAEKCYYEVHFFGNGINIYATKADVHGKVRFSVDGEQEEIVDLYAADRNEQLVYSAKDLEEGEHVLKAVTLNEKSGSKVVNQVNYAEIIHLPYLPQDLKLDKESYLLVKGDQQQISCQAIPDDTTFTDLEFSSSDPKVASVSTNGMITAEKEGEAVITVSSALAKLSKKVKVTVVDSIPAFGGAIVDTNTQYTQNRFDEVTRNGRKEESLTAWKNDHAISEFALYASEKDASQVSVTASDFTNKAGARIPAANVKTYFIKSTTAYSGGYVGGSYPAATSSNRAEASDILSNDSVTDIKQGKLQPVWVDIAVPKDAAAGDYTGTLTAKDGSGNQVSFTYTLHVQDVALKDASEFKGVFDIELWQYPYSSAEYYNVEPFSEEHLKILESSMRKYKEIGGYAITTTIVEEAWSMKDNGQFAGQTYSKNDVHYPSMVKWTKNADDTFSYDYTDFDKWVSFNKSLGIGDKILLYSVAPWHSSFSYWDNGTLKYEVFQAGSDRYKKVWSDFLKDLIAHLEEKGWFEDAYIGIDERGFSSEAFDMIESVKGKNGKPLKTAGAMDAIQNAAKKELALRVSDLNVGSTAAAGNLAVFKEVLAERQSKGLRTTIYSCTGHHPGNFSLSAPVESYWTIINCGKMGTAGFLRWAYDAWVEDPLRDTTHQWFEPGDCFLVYPSEKDASDKAVQSSARLERMAQGVRDVNKLIQIKEDSPQFAANVEALYGKVTTTAGIGAFLTTDQKNALSEEMDNFRKGLADLTEAYVEVRDGEAAKQDRANALAEAEKINMSTGEKDYTKETWDNFLRAYNELKKLTEAEIDAMTAADLTSLTNALRQAQAALKRLPSEEEQKKAAAKQDRTNALAEAEKINMGTGEKDYTKDTWDNFLKAYQALKNLTEAQMDAMTAADLANLTNALRQAQAALKASEPQNPAPTEEESVVTGVKFALKKYEIAKGKSFNLAKEIVEQTPANAKNQTLTFRSLDPKVAAVSAKGVVKTNKKAAKKTAKIAVQNADGKTIATVQVKVMNGSVSKVKVKGKKTLSVKAGGSVTLKASVSTKGGKPVNKKLKWTSSNPKLAVVGNQTAASMKVKIAKTAKKGQSVKIAAASMDGTNKKAVFTIRIK